MSEAMQAANNAVFWATMSVVFAAISVCFAVLSIWLRSRGK